MKINLAKLFLVLILISNSTLAVTAHGDEEPEDSNGTKLISNHPLTGTWTVKSKLNDSSLKFHMGHDRPTKPAVVLRLDLCGNGDTLVGSVEQIKLINAPKKLNVESATLTGIEVPPESPGLREYTVLLNSLRDSNVAVTMTNTITDVAGEMSVSFDNGDSSYTAKSKTIQASGRCLELLNPEQEDESDD